MTGLSDGAFAGMEQRAAARAIAAHCTGFPAGMCEACGQRPSRHDHDFCSLCLRSVPGLDADPYAPITGVA